MSKGPRPRPPHEGRGQAIEAKEPEVRPRVALMVSSAEEASPVAATTTSAPMTVATCPPTPHWRMSAAPKRTGRSSLPSSPRLSQNTSTALAAYDVLDDPPVQPAARGGPGHGRPVHGTTDTHGANGQPHSAPAVGGGTGSSARAARTGEPETRQLTAPRAANALLPRSLSEGAGRCPRGSGPQLGAPSSPARMMNILEAEGGAEVAARLASPQHQAGDHPYG
jgi:hypothetical protein